MTAMRIPYFDVWQAGYAGSSVRIELSGGSTLASVYTDEALSVAASNPQTLDSRTVNGVSYGRFTAPLYVGAAVTLKIDSDTVESGIMRPALTALDDVDASEATVIAEGGTTARALEDIVARFIDVMDYGAFLAVGAPGASASTNAATLAAAVGAAVSAGADEVLVPPGTYAFTTLSLSCLLRGRGGRGGTTLQSTQGSNVVTLATDKAGLANLTLDGVSLQASSVGVISKNKKEIRMHDVTIKRFVTGLKQQGAQRNDFQELYISTCTNGAQFYGDTNASGGADGGSFKYNRWAGGKVDACTGKGVELKYVDTNCDSNSFEDVGFESNTGTALHLHGCRWTALDGDCWFTGNTKDIVFEDDSTVVLAGTNKISGFHMKGGEISSAMTISGQLVDVIFEKVNFSAGTYTINSPTNPVVTVDCTESSTVTLAGTDTTKWVRARTANGDAPSTFGITTNNTVTEAWTYNLAPGERVMLEAKVIASGRNVTDYSMFHIAQSAHRTGSTLAYNAQASNFTVGDIVTGATSGASGRVTADADSGATGTLTFKDIIGEFVNGETLTGALGGSASANGTLSHQNAALLGSITSLETAVESDASTACIFTVSGTHVAVSITGVTNKTFEWTVAVSVVSG